MADIVPYYSRVHTHPMLVNSEGVLSVSYQRCHLEPQFHAVSPRPTTDWQCSTVPRLGQSHKQDRLTAFHLSLSPNRLLGHPWPSPSAFNWPSALQLVPSCPLDGRILLTFEVLRSLAVQPSFCFVRLFVIAEVPQ